MPTRTLIWLDDYRDPFDKEIDWMVFSPIGRNCSVIWLKNYNEFIQYLDEFGLPSAICFDHDLGEEKTGYDCAKYLVEYCLDNNLNLPIFSIQSANPVGKENINKLLTNFRNVQEKET